MSRIWEQSAEEDLINDFVGGLNARFGFLADGSVLTEQVYSVRDLENPLYRLFCPALVRVTVHLNGALVKNNYTPASDAN